LFNCFFYLKSKLLNLKLRLCFKRSKIS